MSTNYWVKQDPKQPLFPDLAWSKPENKMHAGKLLIIGGNLHGFSAPAAAFNAAEKAGIGMTRVILPNAIQKSVKTFMPEADFAPSTPSGSFALAGLDVFLEHSGWADAVLFAGDLGRNSETAVLLESFLQKFHGQLCLTKDALDYFVETPGAIIDRQDTLVVASFAQLQKLFTNSKSQTALTHDMDLIRLTSALHAFTSEHQLHIITKHHDIYLVASRGQVSTTKELTPQDIWRVSTAAAATVWWLQHHTKPFEALTSSVAEDF